MAQWRLVRNGADYEALSKEYGLDPVILRIMRNRGITEAEQINEFLDGDIRTCDDTEGFLDMDKAIIHLDSLKSKNAKLRIIGDYDIDGVCSTYLLYTGLRRCAKELKADVEKIDYEIPDRIKDE